MNIRSLIHDVDPYDGFPYQEIPVNLWGWGSEDPNFATMIDAVQPGLIVEVGSWKGASAIHMAKLLSARSLKGHILCIDTWLGGLEIWTTRDDKNFFPSLNLHHGYPQLYFQFLANVMHVGFQDLITPFPVTSTIGVRWMQLHQIKADLIYIDASHDEADVYADVVNYWDVLNPGGALFGDDFHKWEGVRRAVRRFAAERSIEFQARGRQWVFMKEGRFE